MKTSSGRRNRAGTLGENGLIALAVRSFIGALDIRRKRDMAEALEMPADAGLVMRKEPQSAQAEPTAGENLRFQFPLAKENALPHLHLAARPDKRFPCLGIELAGEEDFDFPRQVLGSGGARWRLRMDAGTPPEQAGGDDARIFEEEEFITSQETGEFREEFVFEKSCGTIPD